MRLVLALALCFAGLPPAAAQQVTTVVARGDFDGDGRIDTVEIAPIVAIIESLIPGSDSSRHVARDRAAYANATDQVAIVVRRAAAPKRLYLLMSSSRAEVEACEIRADPPGEYLVGGFDGKQVLAVKTDVVAILCGQSAAGPGTLLKYWSEARGSFPGAWLPG